MRRTFEIGFCFVAREKEPDYDFALNAFRSILDDHGATGRERGNIILLVQDGTFPVLSMKNVPALHHHLAPDAPVVFAVIRATTEAGRSSGV